MVGWIPIQMVVPRHPGEVGILAPAETGELKAILGASPSGTTLESENFTTDPFSGTGGLVLGRVGLVSDA